MHRSRCRSTILTAKSVFGDAGWSSPVARQAHNLKVVSSNLAPATNLKKARPGDGPFLCLWAVLDLKCFRDPPDGQRPAQWDMETNLAKATQHDA